MKYYCDSLLSFSSPDQVFEDFKERIRHYERQYEEIDETHEPKYSFLKVYNAGTKVLSHKHEGHIQSRIVYYMMNCHITPRTIYLTRHGSTMQSTACCVFLMLLLPTRMMSVSSARRVLQ